MSDPGDSAALFDAIKAGEFDRVKAMVTANPAVIAARSRSGESAILTAVYHRQKEIANLLVARGAPLSIFEAAAAGEVERAERLIADDRASINTFSADGWTPLHLAAFFGHAKIAEMLLAAGADALARSRNSTGNTPLHAALANNHKIEAGLLLGAGADVNAGDAAGWRPAASGRAQRPRGADEAADRAGRRRARGEHGGQDGLCPRAGEGITGSRGAVETPRRVTVTFRSIVSD
jgi:ankyrin repeat protein